MMKKFFAKKWYLLTLVVLVVGLFSYNRYIVNNKTDENMREGWRKFVDAQAEIMFNYPTQWGEPEVELNRYDDEVGANGVEYNITFPNNDFRLSARSVDFSASREAFTMILLGLVVKLQSVYTEMI